MADARRAIHVYLSHPGPSAWHDYAAEAGVSLSGLLQAMGDELAAVAASGQDLAEHQPDLVKAARRVDAGNRRRGSNR